MLIYGVPGSDKPNVFGGEAKSLGLSVSTAMPNGVLQLLTLYPQPVRTQSGWSGEIRARKVPAGLRRGFRAWTMPRPSRGRTVSLRPIISLTPPLTVPGGSKTFASDGLAAADGVMLRAWGTCCSPPNRLCRAIPGSFGEGGFHVRRDPSGQGKDRDRRGAGP